MPKPAWGGLCLSSHGLQPPQVRVVDQLAVHVLGSSSWRSAEGVGMGQCPQCIIVSEF